MASTVTPATTLLLAFNLLFVSAVSCCGGSYSKCPPKPMMPPPPAVKTTKPCPSPPYYYPTGGTCPIDVLKLGVCADVLNGLIYVVIGTPPKLPCCAILQGLLDLQAAVCLCTAVKANVLGINLYLTVDLSLLLNNCGMHWPAGFHCP